jgi:transcriptional regulator with XRE-family HTH domain
MVTNTDRTWLIARRIKEARQAKGLSQEALGERMGLTKVGYGEYERGRRLFDTEQLFQLARVLNRPVEWFLGLDTDLTEDEQQMLVMYRHARTAGVGDMVLGILDSMTASLKEEA